MSRSGPKKLIIYISRLSDEYDNDKLGEIFSEQKIENVLEKTVKKINWPTAFVSTVLILAGCFAYYIHHNCDHLI